MNLAKIGAPWRTIITISLLGLFLVGCQTLSTQDPNQPPEIYNNMPLASMLDAGIRHGGDTLAKVKKNIRRQKLGAQAGADLINRLSKVSADVSDAQLVNTVHLYLVTPTPKVVPLVRAYLKSERALARELAWHMAALRPSAAMQSMLDNHLTEAVVEGEEERVLLPQMAQAVRVNDLKSSYTLVRQGLMRLGNEDFAKAMAHLDPEQASRDFLSYLALAPAEELRQLTLSSVNLYACLEILEHLAKHPAPIGHPNFISLFHYGVSRNIALAERGRFILESYIPDYTSFLARNLATTPVWIQMAYIESARRQMTPKMGLMISELREVTAQAAVVEEIAELRL